MEPLAPAVAVRPMVVADAAAVVEVQVTTWRAAYAGIVPERFLRVMSAAERVPRLERTLGAVGPRETHAVAAVDRRVVGFVRAGACRDEDLDEQVTGEIWAMYVSPDFWDHGVGSVLMAHALDRLRTAAFRAASLWVLEANARARRFYDRAGFTPDGERKVLDLGGPVAEVRCRRAL